MKFWSPASPAVDTHPCLEVEFKKNHVVTRIELRGTKFGVKILSGKVIKCLIQPQFGIHYAETKL
jgi:hypothetical protein